jgi:peptidoglycan hydrolase CwlO-like protein
MDKILMTALQKNIKKVKETIVNLKNLKSSRARYVFIRILSVILWELVQA